MSNTSKSFFFTRSVVVPERHEGFLWKKGARRRNWKKRWFILDKGEMRYYKNPKDKKPAGSFLIKDKVCHEISSASSKYQFSFHITTSERVWYMYAETQSEFEAWKKKITSNGGLWEGNRNTVTVIMDDGSIHSSQVDWNPQAAPSAEVNNLAIDAQIPLKIHYFLEKGPEKKWPVDFLAKLIDSGEDVEARDDKGFTPLMIACTTPVPFSYLELLVQKGAEVNVQNPLRRNEALLHYLCSNWTVDSGISHQEIKERILYLIDHGASMETKNEQQLTPFAFLLSQSFSNSDLQQSQNDVLKHMLKKGANPDCSLPLFVKERKKTFYVAPLLFCCMQGPLEDFAKKSLLLLEYGDNRLNVNRGVATEKGGVEVECLNSLFYACSWAPFSDRGWCQVIETMLKKGATLEPVHLKMIKTPLHGQSTPQEFLDWVSNMNNQLKN